LVKSTGVNAAVLLEELTAMRIYSEQTKQVDAEGYFSMTQEKITEATTLKRREIEKSIKILKEKGLISVIFKGIPRRQYFKIIE
jgi:transcription initiation factor IIE alpha subunit